MTTNPPTAQTARSPTAAVRCPSCRSSDVRVSRWTHEDRLLRRLLYSPYRCRQCRARFSHLSGGAVVLGISGAATLVVAVAIGWIMHQHYEQFEATPPETRNSSAEPAVANPDPSAVLLPSATPSLSEMANSGDPRAQFSLGMAHMSGQEVARDLGLAHMWFQKAAQQDYAEAQYALGSLYLTGRGTVQNFETAFGWFEKAAHQDHAEAQFRLGVMYRSGHAVPVDKTKAYVWFNLAAAKGHERAAEARDSLLQALTADQITRAQRESQAWRPASAKQ